MQAISSEKICFLIVKTREFDVKNAAIIQDMSGALTDDDGLQTKNITLDSVADDPVHEELLAFLEALSDEELIELHAMIMLGRGDVDMEGWSEAVQNASDDLDENLPERLLQIPMISDYLANGLTQFGKSVVG
ncbi:MAG: DUF3775 domain-containing protein [Magnetovibrio sp.]|nr:DUF3775 domain-containing protein [Magnetovibrio sp.]